MRISQMEIPYLNANSIFVTSRRKKFDLFVDEFVYFPVETGVLRFLYLYICVVITSVCISVGLAKRKTN